MRKPVKVIPLCSLFIISSALLTGCNPKKTSVYTLFEAASGAPKKWSPATWETTQDSQISHYTELGLIEFVLNQEKNGYAVVPEMAEEMPTDVTSTLTDEEVKRYQMDVDEEKSGAKFTSGQKWRVKLNKNAKFEDGTPIDADTYLTSLQDILDPKMQNRRAGDYASGNRAIAGALSYLQKGQIFLEPYIDKNGQAHEGDPAKDGWYFNAYESNPWWDQYSFAEACALLEDRTEAMALLSDEETFGNASKPKIVRLDNNAKLKNKVYQVAKKIVSSVFKREVTSFSDGFTNGNVTKDGPFSMATWCSRYYQYPDYPFSRVGIEKISQYEFHIYFTSPVTDFNAKLFFSSNWIMKHDLWERLRKPVADSGLYSTTYGTSVDTYVSYGPYKLTQFQADKSLKFERNENWYGYKDNKHKGLYQIDRIEVQIVANQDTTLSLFRTGKIDNYSLRGEDLNIFGSSSRLMYEPQTFTTKMTINSVFEHLKRLQDKDGKGNHTILSNLKFRKALSLGLDRKTFCQTLTAGWRAFDVPINFIYVSDPSTQTIYRDTPQGKRVVVDNFGKDGGGKPNYFGYDIEEAKKLIDEAVKEESASTKEGHYVEGETVHLIWESYNEGWNKQINWIIDSYKKLVKGTKLDGKLDIETVISGSDYSEHIRAGSCDFAISTWGGSAFDPFGLLEVYTTSSLMFEPDPVYGDYLEINLKTGDWSANKGGLGARNEDIIGQTLGGYGSGKRAGNWHYDLNNGKYSEMRAKSETRLNILSACESYLVGKYNFVTWGARQSVSLNSYRVKEGADHYIQLVGFGGIRERTLTKTDEEWNDWVRRNVQGNGFIDYNK